MLAEPLLASLRAGFIFVVVLTALIFFVSRDTTIAANAQGPGAGTGAGTNTEQDATILAAGDIADCANLTGSEATARLIDKTPGTVLALGDLEYPAGEKDNFGCYDTTWGRHKARTRPAPGNHEHHTTGAAGYFRYFGPSAGTPDKPYYSFDLGAWHIISLDSECAQIGGCQKGSPEEQWLRDDLRSHTSGCILAFWHIPLFSSGATHGNSPR